MNKRGTKGRRAVEWGKNVLIALLTCSALWLAAQTPLLAPLGGLLRGEEAPQAGPGQAQSLERAEAARPLAISVSLAGEGAPGRCGVQYDEAACDALFQQVAGLLVEAISSAGQPEEITRYQWERALTAAPGICLDFGGEIPMPVLVGWLSGEETHLSAGVRRLALGVWQGSVALYYRDEGSGSYYRCRSEVADPLHLEEALANLADNGAFYAFESDLYAALDRDALLPAEAPAPAVYTAANPVSGGRQPLEELMGDLGFSLSSSSFYSSGDEQVARSGNHMVRLSDRGVAVYQAEEGSSQFTLPDQQGDDLLEYVEACRQLAVATLGKRCGQARLYLMSARREAEGLEVAFGYSLNGIPVYLEGGPAARFLVSQGEITQFELRFRAYTDSASHSVVMPPRQAAAALEALDLEGEELLLAYLDSGEDTLSAGWTAAGRRGA